MPDRGTAGISISLVLLLFAVNENMHYALVRNLKVSAAGFALSAAILPMSGTIGRVAH